MQCLKTSSSMTTRNMKSSQVSIKHDYSRYEITTGEYQQLLIDETNITFRTTYSRWCSDSRRWPGTGTTCSCNRLVYRSNRSLEIWWDGTKDRAGTVQPVLVPIECTKSCKDYKKEHKPSTNQFLRSLRILYCSSNLFVGSLSWIKSCTSSSAERHRDYHLLR